MCICNINNRRERKEGVRAHTPRRKTCSQVVGMTRATKTCKKLDIGIVEKRLVTWRIITR